METILLVACPDLRTEYLVSDLAQALEEQLRDRYAVLISSPPDVGSIAVTRFWLKKKLGLRGFGVVSDLKELLSFFADRYEVAIFLVPSVKDAVKAIDRLDKQDPEQSITEEVVYEDHVNGAIYRLSLASNKMSQAI